MGVEVMGYVFALGHCISCGKPFSFNPNLVPSVTVNGKREPVCRECIEAANPKRKALGYPEFRVHPDAYEAADEHEINWD